MSSTRDSIMSSLFPKYVIPTLSLGLVGGIILIYQMQHRHFSSFCWKWKVKWLKNRKRDIKIINSAKEWETIFPRLEREAQTCAVVGFDCEWIQMKGKRRPVALLQLATYSGLCTLVRLNHMENSIPLSLKNFLEDKNILKAGVGTDMDKEHLLVDHHISVRGCIELRYLELLKKSKTCSNAELQDNQEKLGLQALAKKYLNKTISKDWRVRSGDWEAEELTPAQISYAADDALVGIHIFMHLVSELWTPPSALFPFLFSSWKSYFRVAVSEVCSTFVDLKFRRLPSVSSKKKSKSTKPSAKSSKEMSRQTPLYQNSQLWTSDGKPLCVCDPKKAQWYIDKGLGILKSKDPLIVQINFEPAGRPAMEGADGLFYLQERFNVCVTCGKDDSYIRKNIIPHEYRKHFPEILKSHQNHDVVLLCLKCHQISNIKDNILRQQLAIEFDAPLANEVNVKETLNGKLKTIRKVGNALIKSRENLPFSKINKLEAILEEYFGVETLSPGQIESAANLDVESVNKLEKDSHGFKVYLNYKKCGLILLEQRWRSWFLESMEPKFLPENWSVTHNHAKLKVKMSRYPFDHLLRKDYQEALVGTEGYIDVPYTNESS